MAWLHTTAACLMFTSTVLCFSGKNLDETVTHYETLHHSDLRIHHRFRRDTTSDKDIAEKDISFDVLDKHFHLRLHVQRGLFSKTFRAHTVDAQNKKTFLDVDRTNFLEGHLVGIKGKTLVSAYFEGRDIMATIKTEGETYVIEPSFRHLPKSVKHSMIAYRKSDLKKQQEADPEGHPGHSFCGFVHPDGEDEASYNHPQSENDIFNGFVRGTHYSKSGRQRRATGTTDPAHSTCHVHLVADYHFFQDIGQNNAASTGNYLVGQLQAVNQIYRNSNFQGYTGMGFEIKEMTLYAEPTAVLAGQIHHNMKRDTWGTKDLLKAFSKDNNFGNVCLGHLFTNIAFSDGVLGLGWIASSKTGSVGGICSPNSGGYYYNTAWSTLKNKYGRRILTVESELVTAHEFGHNWGSQHDPATDECAPSSFSGGKYTMYTYSVSGFESNNDNFSPCSKRSVAAVLASKASSCFVAQSTNFCGNRQVESPYEECDVGLGVEDDPCCGSDCKLKSGATCSSKNADCCTNCQPTSGGVVCRDVGDQTTTCDGNSTCDGTSSACPNNVFRPDGSACVDHGVCSSGQCLSYCVSFGLLPCICDSVAQSCQTCCKANATATCSPVLDGSGQSQPLENGKPCIQGQCSNGVCVKQIVQLTDRLWSMIESITINNLAVFMKNNLVASCIFFSLIIFIPACSIVACVDWRRDKQDKDEIEWHSKENNTLYLDKDQGQIRQTYTRKRPNTRTDGSEGRRSAASGGSAKNRVYPQL